MGGRQLKGISVRKNRRGVKKNSAGNKMRWETSLKEEEGKESEREIKKDFLGIPFRVKFNKKQRKVDTPTNARTPLLHKIQL